MYVCVCVCVYSETVSSSAKCSPRWIVHPNTTIYGTRTEVKEAMTHQKCLEACVANSSCVAVEWSLYGCWISDSNHSRSHFDEATTFELFRRCNSSRKLNFMSTYSVFLFQRIKFLFRFFNLVLIILLHTSFSFHSCQQFLISVITITLNVY